MALRKVALLAAPSVLWIYARFFQILWRRWRVLWHHARTGGRRMIVHLLSGMVLLAALPLLALLCVPPASRPWLAHGGFDDAILIAVGLLLLAANGSTMWLIPHPKRHAEYRSKLSRRGFANSLSIIHGSNFQFLAMTLSSLAVLSEKYGLSLLQIFLFAAAFANYAASSMMCLWEWRNFAWEDEVGFVKEVVFPILPYGPHGKSNLVGSVGELARDINVYIFGPMLATGWLGLFQVMRQLMQALFPGMIPPPHQAVRQFFPNLVLFMALVMDAGFFSWTQSLAADWSAAMDVALTQALPPLVTLLGNEWVAAYHGEESGISFAREHFLWTSRER